MRKIILHPRSIRSKHFLLSFRVCIITFSPPLFFFPSNNLRMLPVTSPLRDITRKIEGATIMLRVISRPFYEPTLLFVVTVTTRGTESSFLIFIASLRMKKRASKSLSVLIVAELLFLPLDVLERTFIA